MFRETSHPAALPRLHPLRHEVGTRWTPGRRGGLDGLPYVRAHGSGSGSRSHCMTGPSDLQVAARVSPIQLLGHNPSASKRWLSLFTVRTSGLDVSIQVGRPRRCARSLIELSSPRAMARFLHPGFASWGPRWRAHVAFGRWSRRRSFSRLRKSRISGGRTDWTVLAHSATTGARIEPAKGLEPTGATSATIA